MTDNDSTLTQRNQQLVTQLVTELTSIRQLADTLAKISDSPADVSLSEWPQGLIDLAGKLHELIASAAATERKTKEQCALARDISEIATPSTSSDDQLKATERVSQRFADRSREIWRSELVDMELRLNERQDQLFARLEQRLRAMLIKQAEEGINALRREG